jgi:ABC-type uncharacterized transport system auxiliary subunit
MMKRFSPALLLCTLALTACSSMLSSGQPAKQYYALMPLANDGGLDPAGPKVVLSVTAVPGLDTDRIQALGPDARLNHYANARWPDHLPEVLSSVMRRSLAASGHFAAVQVSDRGGDWHLQLEVQQFYGRQGAAGGTNSVVVEMAGTVTCGTQSQPLTLSDSKPVSTERLSAVVAAHQSALDNVTRQVLAQVQSACGYQGSS